MGITQTAGVYYLAAYSQRTCDPLFSDVIKLLIDVIKVQAWPVALQSAPSSNGRFAVDASLGYYIQQLGMHAPVANAPFDKSSVVHTESESVYGCALVDALGQRFGRFTLTLYFFLERRREG